MDCAIAQAEALCALGRGDGVPFWGQGPPKKVSASAIVLLGRVDTNGGGLGRGYSLKASGSGMERTFRARLPLDEYLVDVHIRPPRATSRISSASWCNSGRRSWLLTRHAERGQGMLASLGCPGL
jgi:hypothetical protein